MSALKKNSVILFFMLMQKTIFLNHRIIFNSHGTTLTPEMRGGSETPGKNTTFIPNISETSRYVFYWYFTMQSLNGILFDKTTKTKHKLDVQKDQDLSLKYGKVPYHKTRSGNNDLPGPDNARGSWPPEDSRYR